MANTKKHYYDAAFYSPVGWIGINVDNDRVTELAIKDTVPDVKKGVQSELATQIEKRLEDYFLSGDNWPVNIPLQPAGTQFQKRVWEQLLTIPSGETVTYGALAERLGTSPRAVGGACRANPIPLLIPCHRVVAAHGDGGFAGHRHGFWLDVKRWLLKHEH